MLSEYVASKTKFSAPACAVKSVVANSIFVPEDRSVPDDETEPDSTLILSVDKSPSTTPSNLIDPEAPEASGANEISV